MIGTICSVFSGESFESCLNCTETQLTGRFWEAKRQAARQRLENLRVALASRFPEERKTYVQEQEQQAHPVDPEADGDFGKEDIRKLRGVLIKAQQKDPKLAQMIKEV
jgi:hypothetical protein